MAFGVRHKIINIGASGDNRSLPSGQRHDGDTGLPRRAGPQFLAEIEMETAWCWAPDAEAEESEADLERFEQWLTAISDSDYLNRRSSQRHAWRCSVASSRWQR